MLQFVQKIRILNKISVIKFWSYRLKYTPLHLIEGSLYLMAKNLSGWGTILGHDQGQEQDLCIDSILVLFWFMQWKVYSENILLLIFEQTMNPPQETQCRKTVWREWLPTRWHFLSRGTLQVGRAVFARASHGSWVKIKMYLLHTYRMWNGDNKMDKSILYNLNVTHLEPLSFLLLLLLPGQTLAS